jgi:menaquinone-dependent protoporphyrinogen oxidase
MQLGADYARRFRLFSARTARAWIPTADGVGFAGQGQGRTVMFQVRMHGRGGQGTVTAAELLSIAAFYEGKFAQAFPSFGSERMGAPGSLWRGMALAPSEVVMKPLLVVYATREGHTRKIAERVAATMRARNDVVDVVEAASAAAGFDVSRYGGVVLAASLHGGKHEREMVDFVKANHAALDSVPTAFLSVSLTEAGVEDRTAPFERRAKAAEEVKAAVEAFCHETGLHPSRVWPVAGALLYREYGVLKRLVLRMIVQRKGGDTDTSRDYDYTDWEALDRFVRVMAAEMERAGG